MQDAELTAPEKSRAVFSWGGDAMAKTATKRVGRKTPYTQAEISRAKCQCGKRGAFQWNCCANDNRWVALCADCDVALNETVLAFFRIPDRARLMTRYRRKLTGPA